MATQLETLQKYASADAKKPKLNKLGGSEWNRTKTRVRAAVQDIAKDLVELYAARAERNGFVYGEDTVWQTEFEEMFPFEETEDQIAAWDTNVWYSLKGMYEKAVYWPKIVEKMQVDILKLKK